MRILISNDDGYQAKGIKQLAESLSEIADIIIVAPNENKSAASSSLTLGKPLKPIQIEHNVYAIDATPSDCVHLALCGFIKESIDLVVTGINFGANLGDDVIYSGTVAGAIEGRFIGLPSIAISLASFECEHFETAGAIAKQLVVQLVKLRCLIIQSLMLMFQMYLLAILKALKVLVWGIDISLIPVFRTQIIPLYFGLVKTVKRLTMAKEPTFMPLLIILFL